MRLDETPLIDRAKAHADLHPESACIIAELVERVEGVQATIRRLAFDTWADDLDPDTDTTGGTP